MKRSVNIITVVWIAIVVPIFLSSCASRKSEAIKQRTFVPKNQQVANGERVYMMHCQSCHPGGEAGLGPSINANPAPMFVKRFQIRHGLGVMPGFKSDEISKSDVRDIAKYLKAWKGY